MHTLAILLLLVLAVPVQRIETQYPDPGKVMRLETAMNHLTIIELSEPVTLAAAGSPLFKIERRDNKVFIQPLEEGATTNLFVWTGSGRWSYELVPARSIETTHFAIDQRPAPPSQSQNTLDPPDAFSDASSSQSFAEEMLLFAKPIRNEGVKSEAGQLGAFITDVFRKDDDLFIRYAIDNRTTRSYQSDLPEVFVLHSVQARTSLYTHRYSQLGPSIAKQIRRRSETRIETIECELPSDPLPPGQMATGILTVHLPVTALIELQVLRIVFPSKGSKPISVIVVL